MDALPPHNLDNERAVLGSVLMDRDVMLAIDGLLTPAHFYGSAHAHIFSAMQTCYRNTVAPDYVAVSDALKRAGHLEDIGGISALIGLANSVPTSVHAEHYAALVERDAIARNIIGAAGKIAAVGFDDALDKDTLISQSTQVLTRATAQPGRGAFVPIAATTGELYRDWQSEEEVTVGTPTGYRDIDEMLGGWMRPDLVIIAARPGVGKTSFALCAARNAAKYGPVLFFSQEMSRRQLVERLVSVETGIDAQRVRLRRWRDGEREEAIEALGQLNDLPIEVDDTPAQAIATLRRHAQQYAMQNGQPALVIVDYLQLTTSPDARSRQEEVAEVSRGLKALARSIDTPVLALAQLNRAVESRAGHTPILSDLRESGQIEADADIVAFLHREELYDKETDKKGIAELHVAKSRNGPTGIIPLRFDATTTAFQSLVRFSTMEGY